MLLGTPESSGLVDLDAETKESETELDSGTVDSNRIANLDNKTEESPHLIVLRYASCTKNLSDHFPKQKLTKGVNQEIILERSARADVLLNDNHFGRKHCILGCREQGGKVSVVIKNVSEKKNIFVVKDKEKLQVGPGQECEINNNDKLKIEKLEFAVEIEPGECSARSFEFQVLSQEEHNSDIHVSRSAPQGKSIEHCGYGNVHGKQMRFSDEPLKYPGSNLSTMTSMFNGGYCGASIGGHEFGASGTFVDNSNSFYCAPVSHTPATRYLDIPMNRFQLPSVRQTGNGSVISSPTTEDRNPLLLPSAANYKAMLPLGAVGGSPVAVVQGTHTQMSYVAECPASAAAAHQIPTANNRITTYVTDITTAQMPGANNFVTTHAIKESDQSQPGLPAIQDESRNIRSEMVSSSIDVTSGNEVLDPM